VNLCRTTLAPLKFFAPLFFLKSFTVPPFPDRRSESSLFSRGLCSFPRIFFLVRFLDFSRRLLLFRNDATHQRCTTLNSKAPLPLRTLIRTIIPFGLGLFLSFLTSCALFFLFLVFATALLLRERIFCPLTDLTNHARALFLSSKTRALGVGEILIVLFFPCF